MNAPGIDSASRPLSPTAGVETSGSTEKIIDDDYDISHDVSGELRTSAPRAKYTNSLLAAIGYLDLANAMDFPANVWNEVPLPTFAIVLMALGGTVAIVTTGFAYWDMLRSRKNIQFLREERRYLHAKEKREGLLRIEQAWLDINFRELGWEYIDRVLLDVSMAVAGILVGIGCLLAIKGANPTIFLTSNIMSGYLGNGFVALYAVINTPWAVFMWMRGRRHHIAVRKVRGSLDLSIQRRMTVHGHRHQIYAIVTGIAAIVGGVGSMVSSTLWPGYVVLIPSIMGSIFANYFWRYCLGYDRYHVRDRAELSTFDIAERLRVVILFRRVLHGGMTEEGTELCSIITSGDTSEVAARASIMNFVYDTNISVNCGSRLPRDSEKERNAKQHDGADGEYVSELEPESPDLALRQLSCVVNAAARSAGDQPFRDEERFLLELYGCVLSASKDPVINSRDEPSRSEKPVEHTITTSSPRASHASSVP